MHEFSLVRVGMDSEKVVRKFIAANTKDACKQHLESWAKKETSHALVLCFPNGDRNSHRDSSVYLATFA